MILRKRKMLFNKIKGEMKMADEIMHTVLPSSGGNAWGGSALGAGVGGLIGVLAEEML